MLFLVLNATREEHERKLLTLAVVGAALLYGGYGIYEFLEHPCGRIQSFLGNPNQFAGYLNWILPFFLLFFFFNRPFRARALWFYLALWVFITLVLTFSRGGLIAATFTLVSLALVALYLHRKRLIQLPIRQSLTIAISALVVLTFTGIVLAVQPLGRQILDCLRGSTESRWGPDVTSPQFLGPRPSYYQAGLGLWKENFWLGVGSGNFEEAVKEYYPRKGLGDPDTFIRVHAHNLFLDLAIQYGILGPITFLFFIAAVFKSLLCQWSKSPYALAGIGLLIAFLVHNMFDVSFPLLTGTKWNISQLDLLPILSPLVTFFYLFALAYFIFARPKAVIFLLYPLLLSFLRPSSLGHDVLLLLPLLPLTALLAVWFLRQIYPYSKALAGGFLLLILALPAYGNLTFNRFNRIKTEPNPQLLAFLSENNLRYFHANPFLVERLVPFIERPPKPAFIAYTDEAPLFQSHLRNRYTFQSTSIGQYVIFYNLEVALFPAESFRGVR